MTDATLTAPANGLARIPRALIVLGLAVALGAAGLFWLLSAPSSVSTDNAYLKANTIQIAPKVRGFVAEVLVRDNQAVQAGDPLVRIDNEDLAAAHRLAEADLSRARAAIAAARAALARNQAEVSLAQAAMREAEARIRSADAESKRSTRDRERYAPLSRQGFASQQKFEATIAGSEAAGAEALRVRAALDVARAQAQVTERRADEFAAQLADAQAQEQRAQAALTLATQDLDHAIIRAPVAGIVGDRHVERGEYVQPGTRLMALVPPASLYVLANFKETQTGRMRPGQSVDMVIDALPGQHFAGMVESLSPASGSEFALLPFEPGTGNFTKIVQRLPVRVKLDADALANPSLRPGLSATVSVRLDGGR